MDGIELLFLRLVGHSSDFNQQMRMRQLVNSHCRASRTIGAEKFAVDLVVSREVVHIYEIGSYLDDILEFRIHTFQDVAHIVEDGTGLRPNIQICRSQPIDLRAFNAVVGAARACSGNKKKISSTLDMWILAARRC